MKSGFLSCTQKVERWGIFELSFEGKYTFRVYGTYAEHAECEGSFEVEAASFGNHGPVRVCNTYHFAYEDGTPYYPIGTTCYVWALQTEELQKQTLATLKDSAFNKIRFVFSRNIMIITLTSLTVTLMREHQWTAQC